MHKDQVTIPKGTVVKFNGFPCELTEDAEVISSIFARESAGQDYRFSMSQDEPSALKPAQAPSPDNLATRSSSPESK